MIVKKSKQLNIAVIGLYFTVLLFSAYIFVMFFIHWDRKCTDGERENGKRKL